MFLQILKLYTIFWKLKQLENDLKSPHGAGPQSGPQPRPSRRGGLPRAAGQKAAGPRPTGPVQPRSGPRAARTPGTLRRGHRTRDSAVARSPMALWRLADEKVLG
jgi:hypothetical protein